MRRRRQAGRLGKVAYLGWSRCGLEAEWRCVQPVVVSFWHAEWPLLRCGRLPSPAAPALATLVPARAKRQSLAVQQERAAILDDMARLEVESGAVARAAKAAAKERDDRLVEADVWKLEVRRLRMLLSG